MKIKNPVLNRTGLKNFNFVQLSQLNHFFAFPTIKINLDKLKTLKLFMNYQTKIIASFNKTTKPPHPPPKKKIQLLKF